MQNVTIMQIHSAKVIDEVNFSRFVLNLIEKCFCMSSQNVSQSLFEAGVCVQKRHWDLPDI